MPTDWSQRYAEKDTPWDKGQAHPALVEFVAEHPLVGRILVPGCGLGHDVRAIATPGNRPLGVDIADAAIVGARSFERIAHEAFETGDFLAGDGVEAGTFDWLVEHTCFCAIDPDWRGAYVEAVERALKPGGRVLAVFYLDPDCEEGPPFGVAKAELDRLFSRFETEMERENLPTFPGREGLEILRVLRLREDG